MRFLQRYRPQGAVLALNGTYVACSYIFKSVIQDERQGPSGLSDPPAAEYLNELDTEQDWSRRFVQLISHAIDLRRAGNITKRKIKTLKTKMKKLLGESLTHLNKEFESYRKGILKVENCKHSINHR